VCGGAGGVLAGEGSRFVRRVEVAACQGSRSGWCLIFLGVGCAGFSSVDVGGGSSALAFAVVAVLFEGDDPWDVIAPAAGVLAALGWWASQAGGAGVRRVRQSARGGGRITGCAVPRRPDQSHRRLRNARLRSATRRAAAHNIYTRHR
jgi:hypothetical protein